MIPSVPRSISLWAAQRLIDLGTDGIITDRVDLFSPADQ